MVRAKKRLGLVFFPAFDWAIDPMHPEREERLLYTQDQVFEEGIFDIEGIVEYRPGIAQEKQIKRVHICVPDVQSKATESHLISAGGAITAADAWANKEVDKAFALVRPPGHHARRIVHGARGFCNINIEAVMIEHLRKRWGMKRIAVVDTDCHHGDGTQDIYFNDPDVLFISLHQDGRTLYPGTGFTDELGGPNAIGYTLNLPLPPGTSDEGFLYALDNLVMPVLSEFKPDCIINSAGQDNHYSDPITNMNFSAGGYAELSHRLNADIAVLEGGYSIEDALPYVNTGIILAMAGLDYSGVREPDYSQAKLKQSAKTNEYIKSLCQHMYDVWKNRQILRAKAVKGMDYVRQSRQVYYDTDGIMENQVETTRVCDECSGLSVIESRADNGGQVKAIFVPHGACPKCEQEGYDIYEKPGTPGYCVIQDKKNDAYLEKNQH